MRSTSSPRAVSMITGTRLSARMRRSTSKPDSSGSMTSRMTRSTAERASCSSPSGPVGAVTALKPSSVTYSTSIAHRPWSSSMIKSVGLGSPAAGRFSMENEDTRSFRPPARAPAKRRVLDTSLPVTPIARIVPVRARAVFSAAGRGCGDLALSPLSRPGSGASRRVLQAEGLPVVIVGEHFRVATPADDGAQRLLGGVLRHVVLELIKEAALGCAVAGALIEHAADVGGEWHVGDQVAREQLLALIDVAVRELLPGLGEAHVASLHFREAQQLQRLGG